VNHPVVEQQQQTAILYDPLWRGKISADWFLPQYWDRDIMPLPEGRGSSYFVEYDNHQMVLRHYRRGGLVARWLTDQYFWSGLEQTRPWREWKLLAAMYDMGLPVPKPVAAQVQHQGWFYRGDILIERILDTQPLSRFLQQNSLPQNQWQAIGQCIRRFHQHGIYHADLNAHNILLRDQEIFLIDFDKAEQRPAGKWQQANLQRLLRSLSKLANQHPCFAFNDQDWQQLLEAYQADA
jgi:3-deoxy-D-manno-octulosonic acid kinase